MSAPRIAVIGGGLAGLEAALDCLDAGAQVTLLERRARLGGATWSSHHHGLEVDNGQHVFLRCFEVYRELLRRLGVEDRVVLQDRLDVPVLAPGGRASRIRRSALPAPLHLAPSLARFGPLSLRERLGVARAAQALARLDPADPDHDRETFGSWLARHGQSPAAIERFWDLIARPTLNLPAQEASLALALVVFQRGFLGRGPDGDLGYADVPLQELHGNPALQLLERRGASVALRARVTGVEREAGGALAVRVDGERIIADAVIVATTHEEVAALLPAEAGVDGERVARLGTSPIVSLHVVYDRPVTDLAFAAGLGTPVQFLFDRTRSSGLGAGQYLTVTLSAGGAHVGIAADVLRKQFEPELASLLPGARDARIESFFVTCERAATFRQAPGTRPLRAGTRTGMPRVFLAGAWTDTGWPATMEGAVRSGRNAAREALLALGHTGRLPAAA